MVSIPNFDTDISKFKPSSTVLLWHVIVAKMVLDDCAKFYLEHNWWFYLDPIPSNILPETNSHFSAFSSLLLRLSLGFHPYSAGSVSKTSDTWWQYRYLPPTCKYRQYRYLLSVSCPPLIDYHVKYVCSHWCFLKFFYFLYLRYLGMEL